MGGLHAQPQPSLHLYQAHGGWGQGQREAGASQWGAGSQEHLPGGGEEAAGASTAHAPLSYWTSLTKYEFKDKIIKLKKMVTAVQGPLLR